MTRKISKIPQIEPGFEGTVVLLAMAAEMPGVRDSAELMAEYAEQAVARGDRAEALDWFSRIVEGGEEEVAPHAALRIGVLVVNDEPSAAQAALRFAADHGLERVVESAQHAINVMGQHGFSPRPEAVAVTEVVGRTHLARGRIWTAEGDMQAAIHAFRDASESPDTEVQAAGLARLGSVLALTGDPEAESTLELAFAGGHPEHASSAGIDLAAILINRGELDRAAEVLRQAATGEGWPAGMARVNLGVLLAQQLGDVAGGLTELWTAAASDVPLVAAAGLFNAATVLEDNGELDRAESAYEKAGRLRQPRFSGQATNNLAIMLSRQGRIIEAHTAWQLATEIGDPEEVAKAQRALDTLAELGDLNEFQAAVDEIDLTDPRTRAIVAMNAGEQCLATGDLTEAHRAYEAVMATGDPYYAPKGAAMVALMFSMAGHGEEGAAVAIAHLREIGFPEFEPRAWYFYGEFSLRREGLAHARECWLRIPESARDAYPAAACVLAVLNDNATDAATAFEEVWQDVHELAETVVATIIEIAGIHLGAGETARARRAYEVGLQLAERADLAEFADSARKALNECA